MIGRAVRCSSGRPTPPRPGRSGRPSPWAARSFPVLIGAAAVLIGAGRGQKKSQGGRRWPFALAFSFLLLIEAGRVLPGADRGRGRRALVPAAPDPPARGTGHGSRWHRSRAAQFRRRMIRQNAAGRRGQILHLTAYRPIGNGELGSMPPYYPPYSPPSSPDSAGVNPSRAILSAQACKIYACTLCPAAAAAARISPPRSFGGRIWIESHFAIYRLFVIFFFSEIGIISPLFARVYYIIANQAAFRHAKLHKHSVMFLCKK